jgi:NADPH-dependent 7-cyano-7-deazaguanine reductase QueF-like protein
MVDPKQMEGLSKSQINLMKRVEKENAERVEALLKMRRRNNWTGLGITAIVFSIYGYSMWAVKQEGFLDSLDEPVKK